MNDSLKRIYMLVLKNGLRPQIHRVEDNTFYCSVSSVCYYPNDEREMKPFYMFQETIALSPR